MPKDFDSLKLIGFPTTKERDSVTGKHKLFPASVLNISHYSMFQNYGYDTDHGVMLDSINYRIQTRDAIINQWLKGYSGSPVFIKDKI
ncbi:MAG: hypothetical protein M3139_14460 [Bacteroidota bacterium]|nr:hypothetical protein [Bacteroidota bacterium]